MNNDVAIEILFCGVCHSDLHYHLNRAMHNGLTEKAAGEMLTQLAFYAGWPTVFSAMPVFKEVFATRSAAVVE